MSNRGSVMGRKILMWKEGRDCRKIFLRLAATFVSLMASLFSSFFNWSKKVVHTCCSSEILEKTTVVD